MRKNTLLVSIFTFMAAGLFQPNLPAMNISSHFASPEESYKKRVHEFTNDFVEFQKFALHFAPPHELLKELQRYETTICESSKLFYPTFMSKKGDISRIINAHRIENYLCQNKVKFIRVPRKYLFLAGGRWVVIAEKIDEAKPEKSIGLAQLQELVDIVLALGFSDFHDKNVLTTRDGNFVFIDTEDNSFLHKNRHTLLKRLQAYLIEYKIALTQEAHNWLRETIKNLDPEEQVCAPGIHTLQGLDTHSFDTKKLIADFQTIKVDTHNRALQKEQEKWSTIQNVLGAAATITALFLIKASFANS
jgi:hypothetical protein